jgi:TonB family protein
LRRIPGSREPIRLDSRDLDPKYRKYFEDVRRMIKDKLRYPCVKEQAQCNYKATQLVVDFGIGKDGSVPHVFVSTPSEFEIYNETVVADIRMAAPFPPLPQQLQDDRPVLPLRLTINYSFTRP